MITNLLISSGCVRLSPGFITVVKDHRSLTNETNSAIILTLKEECDSAKNQEQKNACLDLIDRLEIITKQSNAIDSYITNEITERDLILYLRSRWSKN